MTSDNAVKDGEVRLVAFAKTTSGVVADNVSLTRLDSTKNAHSRVYLGQMLLLAK